MSVTWHHAPVGLWRQAAPPAMGGELGLTSGSRRPYTAGAFYKGIAKAGAGPGLEGRLSQGKLALVHTH